MNFHIYVLQSVAFLDLFAVSLIIPLLPRHVTGLGAGYIYVGLLRSLYSGFQVCSGPLIGCLGDLRGRRSILLMSLAMPGLVYILMGTTNSLVIILLLRAYLGIVKQTHVLMRAMIPDYEPNPQKQVEIYGKIVAASGLGTSTSPIMAGYFLEANPTNGFAFLSVIVGLLFFLNTALVYFLLPDVNKITRKKRTRKRCNKGILNSITSILKQSTDVLCGIKWSMFWDVFLLRFLIGFAMGIYYSSYSIYLTSQFGLTPKYIGYIVSFQALVGTFSCYFAGFVNQFYTNDQDYTLRNLHVFIMMTVAFIGLTFSKNIFLFTLCLVPLGISSSWGRLLNIEMVLHRGHGKHSGSLIGASNSIKSISTVVAPLVGGIIGHYNGVSSVSYASLLAAALGLIISYKIKLKN